MIDIWAAFLREILKTAHFSLKMTKKYYVSTLNILGKKSNLPLETTIGFETT